MDARSERPASAPQTSARARGFRTETGLATSLPTARRYWFGGLGQVIEYRSRRTPFTATHGPITGVQGAKKLHGLRFWVPAVADLSARTQRAVTWSSTRSSSPTPAGALTRVRETFPLRR
jgi:hypothetical protein